MTVLRERFFLLTLHHLFTLMTVFSSGGGGGFGLGGQQGCRPGSHRQLHGLPSTRWQHLWLTGIFTELAKAAFCALDHGTIFRKSSSSVILCASLRTYTFPCLKAKICPFYFSQFLEHELSCVIRCYAMCHCKSVLAGLP